MDSACDVAGRTADEDSAIAQLLGRDVEGGLDSGSGFGFGKDKRDDVEGDEGAAGAGIDFEKVSAAIQEARAQRDRLQCLPDAERREAAAAMVMRLAEMMGFEEGFSGSEDDDEEVKEEVAAAP